MLSQRQSSTTQNLPWSWVELDLGWGRAMQVSHYCLCHGDKGALRNWELQGSDEGVHWTTLRRHVHETTLGRQPWDSADWVVDSDGESFRLLRVQQRGQNSKGTHDL